MDLKIHRTILYLALKRVIRQADPKLIIPASDILNRTFYPMWQGNWLTDMNQASAFFDVVENKYRDPYTRWKHSGTYDFPKAIAEHGTEWVNLFQTLWVKEYEATSAFPEFRPFSPDTQPVPRLEDANQIGGYYPYDHFDVADRQRPLCPKCYKGMSDKGASWLCSDRTHPELRTSQDGTTKPLCPKCQSIMTLLPNHWHWVCSDPTHRLEVKPTCHECSAVMMLTSDSKWWECSAHPKLIRQRAIDFGGLNWEAVPDTVEYVDNDKLSRTIRRGVFAECLEGPLMSAFGSDDRSNALSLRKLGKALHTLQDLYAHSNFIELLLGCADEEGLLPDHLSEMLKKETAGSFASYLKYGKASDATVVTGRFDQVDTVASILRIYRENLVPIWQDIEAGGYYKNAPKGSGPRDLIVDVLFGTFSNQPFVPKMLDVVKEACALADYFSEIGETVKKGVIEFFAWVGGKLSPENKSNIKMIEGLLLEANSREAKDYANTGRILYAEHVIEKTLRAKLEGDRADTNGRVLPHHTLIAKDHDTIQPECRLAFKLGALMAVDLTAQMLEVYLTGGDLVSAEAVLQKNIQHPGSLLSAQTKGTKTKLKESDLPTLYGERWWQFGDDPKNDSILP
jgi:hypothetical protein